MPYQNRVDPWGSLAAASARGTLMGNRGNLHDSGKEIIRNYQTKRWIICKLAFKGRKRTVMSPGRYTELFFLDEATAFAAGHRPCAECQRARYEEFKESWLRANPGFENRPVRIEEIDAALHRERYDKGKKVTYKAALNDLPDGAFFSLDGAAYLVSSGGVYRWSFSGYTHVDRRDFPDRVDVLTPRSIVKTFEGGFHPEIHPSASG
jgi:hypothetical protein